MTNLTCRGAESPVSVMEHVQCSTAVAAIIRTFQLEWQSFTRMEFQQETLLEVLGLDNLFIMK